MNSSQRFASIRRTASQLLKDPGPQAPLGEFLWKLTRQVRFASPVKSMRRRFRNEGVYCERGEVNYMRAYVRPSDPKTSGQIEQRQGFGGSQAAWRALTAEERDGWSAYGQRWFAEELSSSPGPNVYTKAQSCRRGWGEVVLSHTPPVLPPPPLALSLEEVAAPAAGRVAFRVRHSLSGTEGYRIELRMTPAMINGRKPQEPQFRRAGETAPESFFPLAESGAVYLLESPRSAVAPGERFGLGVRLITPEGIPGPELRVDEVRKAPENGVAAEGGALASLADGKTERFRQQSQGRAQGASMACAVRNLPLITGGASVAEPGFPQGFIGNPGLPVWIGWSCMHFRS